MKIKRNVKLPVKPEIPLHMMSSHLFYIHKHRQKYTVTFLEVKYINRSSLHQHLCISYYIISPIPGDIQSAPDILAVFDTK
jgi:hypothetical protein